jgi:hypothetical protein
MTAFWLHGQVTRGKMATASIPISPQASPAPSVSTIDVETLGDTTSILKPKKNGSAPEAASASIGTNSPLSQHGPNKDAEPTPETKALINTVLAVGKEWQSKRKTVTDYFEQHKLEVLTLRNEFGVKQGTKGKMLYVPQTNGTLEPMYWSEFVSLAFAVSERHINRLLGINEPPNPTDATKSKNFKAGFAAGQEAALRERVQAPAVAQPFSKLDKSEPYTYFEQFKNEKATFASELAAMVVRMFGSTDADEIVEAFSKEVNRQQIRKAEAARCDLDKLAEKEPGEAERGAKKPAATSSKSAKTKKVLVARVGDTTEFGVFSDSCNEHTITNALTIGTKQSCEGERDRINAKCSANAESLGVLLAASNTQVQQTAGSVQ